MNSTQEPNDPRTLFEQCYHYARSLTRDADRAEDLAQEAWAAVLASGKPRTTPYMLRIVRNRFIDRCRHDARWRMVHEEAGEPAAIDGEAAPWQDWSVDRIDLERAIARLPEHEQRALYLHNVEGWTTAQIAERYDMPKGTVLTHLHRARHKLRVALAAGAVLLALFLGWRLLDGGPVTVREVVAEIAYNHGKGHPSAIEATAGYAGLDEALAELSFTVAAPTAAPAEGLMLVSGQYCSVDGEMAAQLTLTDDGGGRYTMYLVDAAPFAHLELPAERTTGETTVWVWREGNVIFGLAGPARR